MGDEGQRTSSSSGAGRVATTCTEGVCEAEQSDLQAELHLLLNFAETQPRWLKAWIPMLGPTLLSHDGCPFRVVSRGQHLWGCPLGKLKLKREKPVWIFVWGSLHLLLPFYGADKCCHPPLWLSSCWEALAVFECSVIGIVQKRNAPPFFAFLSLLSFACTLSLPLYKTAADNSWKCLSPLTQASMSLKCCRGNWETICGQQRPRWNAEACVGGHPAALSQLTWCKCPHVLEDFLCPNTGGTIH